MVQCIESRGKLSISRPLPITRVWLKALFLVWLYLRCTRLYADDTQIHVYLSVTLATAEEMIAATTGLSDLRAVADWTVKHGLTLKLSKIVAIICGTIHQVNVIKSFNSFTYLLVILLFHFGTMLEIWVTDGW